MNALTLIAITVVIIAGVIAFSQNDVLSLTSGGSGSGPIATGPNSSEIRNPQPVARQNVFRRTFRRSTPAPTKTPVPAPTPTLVPPGASPYEGKIIISRVQRSGTEAKTEYITVRHQTTRVKKTTEGPIDVTGWRLSSRRSFGIIPRAYDIPEIETAERNILLPPGGEVTIVSGTPAYARNFRENACTGYFNQTTPFVPALTNTCLDDDPSRAGLLARNFSGACIDFIIRIPECRTAKITFEQSGLGQTCLDYINQNFNYTGCVANLRSQPGFLRDRWRAYFGSNIKMFDPRHDSLTLYDRSGLAVDTFEY